MLITIRHSNLSFIGPHNLKQTYYTLLVLIGPPHNLVPIAKRIPARPIRDGTYPLPHTSYLPSLLPDISTLRALFPRFNVG